MLSATRQKARAFASIGAVSALPNAARIGIGNVDQIGQRSVSPHRHHRFECLVDREAERRGIDAHAGRVDAERRASLGQRERLSKFSRDRIARLSAERGAAEAARADRRRKAKSLSKDHRIIPPAVEPAEAEARRRLDTISRTGAQEAVAFVGLLVFAIGVGVAAIAEGGGARFADIVAAIM
ncbi:hypothetical protein [Mesorhizobium sp. KR2-14]|uniref:hypothetical protein n=1 Tax=Mesorhizobium sp. KR2-14 TaxID=3156610 RepID=UPI0032B5236C